MNWFGRLTETQFRLVPQSEVYAFRNPDPWSDGEEQGRTGLLPGRPLRTGTRLARQPAPECSALTPPGRVRAELPLVVGGGASPQAATDRSGLFLAQRTGLLMTSTMFWRTSAGPPCRSFRLRRCGRCSGVPDRGGAVRHDRGAGEAEAENHRFQRPSRRQARRCGHGPDPVRGLGTRKALAEAVPEPVPGLRGADHQGLGPRHPEILHRKAPHLRGGGALPDREGARRDRPCALYPHRRAGKDRPVDQAPAHHGG